MTKSPKPYRLQVVFKVVLNGTNNFLTDLKSKQRTDNMQLGATQRRNRRFALPRAQPQLLLEGDHRQNRRKLSCALNFLPIPPTAC